MADLSLQLTVEFQLVLGCVSSVCLLSWCGWLWCFYCISETGRSWFNVLSGWMFMYASLPITIYRVFMGSSFAASSSHVIPNSWLPARSKITAWIPPVLLVTVAMILYLYTYVFMYSILV
ncbi:hypothetical protein HanXRQr2_Chr08g0356571 [Helianthus annuus]|uniref:Uncharacterized protein n=1 Tax=Helianthus annuus TaxID=4232 RepID=A0A9K3NEU4_HELAN|nr:hypothetical protein HanXRQr2_Chr08g0356571 [Helianthus annuus]KAJ0903027.1 hypothetical protein HanPSC8_Chr08g0344301 [Helianthus annuus]